MCSRYTYNKDEAKLKLRDQILVFGFVPRGDIRPTDLGPVIIPEHDGFACRQMSWGCRQMGLAGRVTGTQARPSKFALGFGFPLESAARCLAASVRLFLPVRHPSRRPARQVSFLFSSRRFTGLITVSKIHAMHHNCHQWLTSGYGKTVSKSGFRVMKNSGDLKIILLETPIKSAILLALNCVPCAIPAIGSILLTLLHKRSRAGSAAILGRNPFLCLCV